jgi:hypothetical protein
MRVFFAMQPLILGLALCAGLVAPASAQDVGEPQQITPAVPPAQPENPLPGTPSPAPAPQAAAPALPADLQDCLHETGDYVTHGKTVDYVIGITNTCEKRLRCEIFANVTGVKGSSLGHTVMILGAASSGAAAKKTYVMPVKSAGGITQVSRECKVI